MANNYLNDTGLAYYHNRIKTLFATKGELPTSVSDLTNDADYQSASEVESAITGKGYQTAAQVNSAIESAVAGITGVSFEVVQTLPSAGDAGTIYLISNSGTNPNIYDEYIYVNNSWEKIGTTDVDLSQYWAKSELVAMTTAEIDALFA